MKKKRINFIVRLLGEDHSVVVPENARLITVAYAGPGNIQAIFMDTVEEID